MKSKEKKKYSEEKKLTRTTYNSIGTAELRDRLTCNVIMMEH